MSKVIVFIDGPFPTEDDRELAAKHGTKCFRNGREPAGLEPHTLAVATDLDLIPEGYRTTEAPQDAPEEVPTLNPTAPKQVFGGRKPLVPEV